MNALNNISVNKKLYLLLGISMLYFVYKGVTYALIGSYVPLVFIMTVLILFYWSLRSTKKVHRSVIRLWSVLIILWSLVRLTLWIGFNLSSSLRESHMREQFTVSQNTLSILMLIAGFLIFRALKNKRA